LLRLFQVVITPGLLVPADSVEGTIGRLPIAARAFAGCFEDKLDGICVGVCERLVSAEEWDSQFTTSAQWVL